MPRNHERGKEGKTLCIEANYSHVLWLNKPGCSGTTLVAFALFLQQPENIY